MNGSHKGMQRAHVGVHTHQLTAIQVKLPQPLHVAHLPGHCTQDIKHVGM